MPRKLMSILILLAAAYACLCGGLYLCQRSLMYFPQPAHNDAGATLALAADGAQVVVRVRPRESPNAVIYFGGNAEDVSSSLPQLAAAFPDQSLYLMHYRGYGGSGGSPSESALIADARLLFDVVRTTHPHITVVGRSLGSGVAVHLASERPAGSLILITPYSSILELATRQFPYVPVRWILRDKFESWKYASKISVPTLLVMAEHDEIIPAASTRALYRQFGSGVARLEVVPGAGHNSIADSPAYARLLSGAYRPDGR